MSGIADMVGEYLKEKGEETRRSVACAAGRRALRSQTLQLSSRPRDDNGSH